jgi:uncharacterized membrane protein
MTTEAEKPQEGPQEATSAEGSGAAGSAPRPFASQMDMLAGVSGTTARIVYRAASVLEEELNAGIEATQRLEGKLVDAEKLRSGDPQEIMQRFRRDAHDVVDILIDLVNVATNAVGDMTQRMVKIQMDQAPNKGGAAAGSAIPALTVPTPVSPGGEVQVPMTIENESDRQTEEFGLLSSDLVNAEGERIAAEQITFSPERIVLEPRKSAITTVSVRVPEDAKPGLYSGLLQASRLEHLRAVITIQIIHP